MPNPALIYRSYRTEHLVLVAPRDHALAARPGVDFAEVLQHDFVGMGEHASLQAFLVHKAEAVGLPIKLRIRATSFESLCSLVESGIGLGVIPASAAQRHAQKMRIAVVPLRDAWAERELRIAVRDTASLTAAATALIEALSAEAAAGEPA